EAVKWLEKQCESGKRTVVKAAGIRAAIQPVRHDNELSDCDIVVKKKKKLDFLNSLFGIFDQITIEFCQN
ncbi:hypothetical protein F9877_17355, partial [Morganella morganii]|uniref:hypothetical protein n=1 Tax=Morganella morganii TaxID=582 RepID=UPI0019E38455